MREKIIQSLVNNEIFVNEIFSLSFDDFVKGEYVNQISRFMENKRTMRISARDHFKSTSFYAHFMRHSMMNADKNVEGHYFSFKQGMAGYHIRKIRQLIKENPIFNSCRDMKTNAENVIKLTWDGKHHHTLEPQGLMSFKRGIHCDLIYVDDPFQDPASKLVTTIIDKINSILKTQILDMVKKDGQLHIAGTPQTVIDFFFDKELQKSFETLILPAIVNEKEKKVLWKEWMSWNELQKRKKERGVKVFNQEYLCTPVYTEQAFFHREQIISLVNEKYSKSAIKDYETNNDVVAGFDIGKKAHPSHLAVFEIVDGKMIMIFQKFMDHWDYIKQVDYLDMIIKNLKVDRLYYDDTRGEFESLYEQGVLPNEMEPVHFTNKIKVAMATEFEKAVVNKTMTFLNDQRLINQVLVVDNDLNAITTPEGHGDSFWSIALAFSEVSLNMQPEITIF